MDLEARISLILGNRFLWFYRTDFSDSTDPIFSDSWKPMIIFSDSRDPIFNSRDPNRVPKTPLKNYD